MYPTKRRTDHTDTSAAKKHTITGQRINRHDQQASEPKPRGGAIPNHALQDRSPWP